MTKNKTNPDKQTRTMTPPVDPIIDNGDAAQDETDTPTTNDTPVDHDPRCDQGYARLDLTLIDTIDALRTALAEEKTISRQVEALDKQIGNLRNQRIEAQRAIDTAGNTLKQLLQTKE